MSKAGGQITNLISPNWQRDRVVPPTGFTAILTVFTSAVMAFLIVFSLALSIAASRLAGQWGEALALSTTLKISVSSELMDKQVAKALKILRTTPGIKSATVLSVSEKRRLLEPWFGPKIPVELLPLPALINIQEDRSGYDAESLRLRLVANVPSAVLDNHKRWRRPLVISGQRLSVLGVFSMLLMTGTSGAMITLAARASMSANAQVISVLRLIGATDTYIASAFMRRFTLRALVGSTIGTASATSIIYLFFNEGQAQPSILTDFGFQSTEWLWLILIPPFFGTFALLVTWRAAQNVLRGLT
ncbi:MAG: cell division protein FtsX [Rhodobacteraceae bacterium]|nr:cell division protein FtsX [Paracoccaceae bacterium]